MKIEACGIELELHASGAAYWPANETLLVADLHLGKETVFQKAGIAIPAGASATTLDRMRHLLDAFGPRRVIVLGDLIHAKVGWTEGLKESLTSIAGGSDATAWSLVPGNHDRGALRSLAGCGWQVLDSELVIDGVHLVHAPQTGEDRASLSIAGHLHPSISLALTPRDRARVRCFWLRENRQLVLPAFGGWTGTKPIVPALRDRVFVCAEGSVIEVSGFRSA